MRRIAILEGHPVAAIGLKVLIDAAPSLVLCGVHTDGRSLVSFVREQSLEVVAIDLELGCGQLRTLKLVAQLRAVCPGMDIVIVSGVDAVTRRECFEAGATAVLDKSVDSAEILAHFLGSGEVH